jgi:hypothetical protein
MRLLPVVIRLALRNTSPLPILFRKMLARNVLCSALICSSNLRNPAREALSSLRPPRDPSTLIAGTSRLRTAALSVWCVSSVPPAALVTRADLSAAVLFLRLRLPVSNPGCSSTVLTATA